MSYQRLHNLFKKLSHLEHISGMLYWDESAMMPPGGGTIRSEASATLHGISHGLLLGKDLLACCERAKQEDLSDWQRKNLELMRQKIATKQAFTPAFIEKKALLSSKCEQSWPEFKKNNDWKGFKKPLSELIELAREESEILSSVLEVAPYDALIHQFEPGLTQEIINPLFDSLKQEIPPLMTQVVEKQGDRSVLPFETIDADRQHALALDLMKSLGFDFQRGRLDTSVHPFCGGDPRDVRLTTRYREEDFSSSIMGVLHETGHAMYEQGLPEEWLDQPVGKAIGMSAHESQSLFVEMQICRSNAFFKFVEPKVKQYFKSTHPSFNLENIRQSYHAVRPSLIRIDADELTYPLHVVLRYEIEKEVISNQLPVDDIPELWNQKMQDYLGIDPGSKHGQGCMQDVHWSASLFGYFPSYTLGALIASQLKESMLKDIPHFDREIEEGNFSGIFGWLQSNFHSYGSLLSTSELLQKITGSTLKTQPFLTHIKQRYLDL